jgi:hypothetical protein
MAAVERDAPTLAARTAAVVALKAALAAPTAVAGARKARAAE